ncbi:MAG: potassium-transporting ATPase subunit KdpB, partial [Solirubrobacteraceae bacterium]
AKNPVMFVVEVGSAFTTLVLVRDLFGGGSGVPIWFTANITLWLWFTVVFANFAEAIAEGRGKAQAASLRRMRKDTTARRLTNGREEQVAASTLRKGDTVIVEAGALVPADGEIVEGIASVDESAITGESAPVIRESGGDRSAVTGGTKVLSDRILVRVTANLGESFLDRMIALVEGASRQKTPNEIALHILLVGLTVIFLFACVTLAPLALYAGVALSATMLVALLVCLIPTTIGGLLSAIGIAGMDRLLRKNVIAMSGRAVEAAGDVDTLLLDKTGTITLGNRMATELLPARGVDPTELAEAAQLASLADETPEGRSIVVLAKERYGLRGRDVQEIGAHFIRFSAQTRMSGCDLPDRSVRKGAVDAIRAHVRSLGGDAMTEIDAIAHGISDAGGTPLAVSDGKRILGIVHLKDVVKGGIQERFARFRAMGIRTVMITGDN